MMLLLTSTLIYIRDQVEEGMSSGGSTGMPATPAPTPFSHGPGGVRPEDLAAGISRLAVHFVVAPYFKSLT